MAIICRKILRLILAILRIEATNDRVVQSTDEFQYRTLQ